MAAVCQPLAARPPNSVAPRRPRRGGRAAGRTRGERLDLGGAQRMRGAREPAADLEVVEVERLLRSAAIAASASAQATARAGRSSSSARAAREPRAVALARQEVVRVAERTALTASSRRPCSSSSSTPRHAEVVGELAGVRAPRIGITPRLGPHPGQRDLGGRGAELLGDGLTTSSTIAPRGRLGVDEATPGRQPAVARRGGTCR